MLISYGEICICEKKQKTVKVSIFQLADIFLHVECKVHMKVWDENV